MQFAVDTEAMSSSASKIGVAAEQIDALLGKIRADVATMLGGWGGSAANAHKDLHTRFDADVVSINRNLRQMQAALQNTHALYVQQESEQSADHTAMRNVIAG